MKTIHFDCTSYPDRDAAHRAALLFLKGDPDTIVFHKPTDHDWEFILLAYETGVEVVVTAFPVR